MRLMTDHTTMYIKNKIEIYVYQNNDMEIKNIPFGVNSIMHSRSHRDFAKWRLINYKIYGIVIVFKVTPQCT